jgi:O-methyltransferase involved in polyketide biosynthesis
MEASNNAKKTEGEEKSSTTAALILAMGESDKEKRPELSNDRTSAIEKDALSILAEQLPEGSDLRETLKKPAKEQRKDFRNITADGSTLHIAMRRLLVKQQVDSFIEGNKDTGANVLVLGAGFDFNSYANHQHNTNVNFLEVDMAGTSKNKQDILEQLSDKHGKIGENLKFASATLGKDPIEPVLTKENGFDKSKPTLVVAEGVLEFLVDGGIKELFSDLNTILPKNSKTIFSAQEGDCQDFNDGEKANSKVLTVNDYLKPIAQSGVNITGKAMYHALQMQGRNLKLDSSLENKVLPFLGNQEKVAELTGIDKSKLEDSEYKKSLSDEEKTSRKLVKYFAGTGEHFFTGDFGGEKAKEEPPALTDIKDITVLVRSHLSSSSKRGLAK